MRVQHYVSEADRFDYDRHTTIFFDENLRLDRREAEGVLAKLRTLQVDPSNEAAFGRALIEMLEGRPARIAMRNVAPYRYVDVVSR
jgi:hypothetical protein